MTVYRGDYVFRFRNDLGLGTIGLSSSPFSTVLTMEQSKKCMKSNVEIDKLILGLFDVVVNSSLEGN